MNRRGLLKIGASLGTLAGVGWLGRHVLLPPRRSRVLAPMRDLAEELVASLDPEARARACVPYDHPYRQYHNRGVWGGGLAVRPWSLQRAQRRLLTDILHAGLSEAGRDRVPNQFFVHWPGVHLLNLLVCGDPRRPPYQIVLTGPHLNLRLGGASPGGVAFGGPQVYGDQRGDGRPGLPGNVYRYQLEIALRLLDAMTPAQRAAALLPRAPVQTQIDLQGPGGSFPGIAAADLGRRGHALAAELVDSILSTHAEQDVAHAWSCIEGNGGVETLHVAFYADGAPAAGRPSQVFRLEGPGTVLHFRGAPHVHAFVHVAADGDRPLSVGELLGHNPVLLEGAGVARLFAAAMRARTGAELGHYPLESVAGRLRAGPVRTGDLYSLESWQDAVVVARVRGADLSASLVAALRGRGEDPQPDHAYTVATTGHAAASEPGTAASPGRSGAVERGGLVRDALIAHLRERGFESGA